ncbi:hypothetical protein [Leptospira mayottensis]|uniref:Uncharacterized protein n=2 Tax=Leptospira mayottensis TaxID=1137606 RepID=A0AA87ML59_9LEPT|nr:hypothetical protein [Leptospira mayottensis]AXR60837.1 hypothetical protein DQM68_09210 [Leptospira mayottensis]AXR64714.1 hypothetical protein DQM28_11295 [Leptospira mayottensis]AZQ02732.1 hypothetical protein LEP1GSC190_12480 [Leptospira mayottensis 200901116]EKR98330.1 hypothetical protein LEP1GSC125_1290 [Leptospira mayottensis 200901122]TGM99976.1 hypothetical protein EHR03_13475 [Leptospira mayottensis]
MGLNQNNKAHRSSILPLRFSEEAVAVIRTHLANRPESSFHLRIERKGGHASVQVGYEQKKNLNTIHAYPIKIEISEEDEICLEGSRIDWKPEKQEFYIYPDVDLDIEYQNILNRFKIRANRNVFRNDKARIYRDPSEFPNWFPLRIRKLEISKVKIQGKIWILALAHRYEPEEILKIESTIADEILDYFSDFPDRND